MIGICAGLALKGCQPFAYTIATFTLYRPFEMVRDDLCYQNLPVTVVGMGAGVIYSTLGGTHHTQEDIAIAGAHPQHADHRAVRSRRMHRGHACTAPRRSKGPVYLRIGKAGEPNFTDKAVDPWVFGKLRYIKRGSDVCILSYGVIMKTAMQLAQTIRGAAASRFRWCPATRSSRSTSPASREALRRPQARRRHRGARAAGRPGAAHQADRLGHAGHAAASTRSRCRMPSSTTTAAMTICWPRTASSSAPSQLEWA